MAMKKIAENFGKYHILQFFFTCVPALFFSISTVNFVFVAGDLNYRCRVPECENSKEEFSTSWWPNDVTERCFKPILNATFNDVCTNTSFLNSLEICKEWVYETKDTVLSELNLACDPIRANMIGTVHNLAMAISMFLTGWVADWIGRKPTLIICSSGMALGMLKTLTSTYYVYISIEFLESIMTGGIVTSGLLLMIETSRKRTLSGVLYEYSVYLGEVVFACIAMAFPYWKTLIYVTYIPTILFLLYIPITNESLRWLIVNKKIDAAKDVVKNIIKMNKIQDINPKDIDEMDLDNLKVECDVKTYEHKEGMIDALKCYEINKRLLVAIFCRFTVCFTYYGLTFNSVLLPGNKYVNFLLSSFASFPGNFLCLIVMDKFGRKPSLITAYATTAVFCIIFSLIPEEFIWLKIALYLTAKLFIAVCYTGTVTYIMELFPTSVRGSFLGLCIFIASIGTIVAPLTPALTAVSPFVTPVCFGVFSFISSCLILFLTPETKGNHLIDSVEQLKNIVLTENNTKK